MIASGLSRQTASFRDAVRLRHRRCGAGGLRARQPALRGPRGRRAADRGRRPGHQPADRRPAGVRRAAGRPGDRVALPHAAVRAVAAGRALGAGQDARRVQRGQRDGLQPRPARGLRRARAARQPRLGLGRHAPGLQDDRGQPARDLRCRGAGGPLQVSTVGGGDALLEDAIAAGTALGWRRMRDLNETDEERIGYAMATIRDGARVQRGGCVPAPGHGPRPTSPSRPARSSSGCCSRTGARPRRGRGLRGARGPRGDPVRRQHRHAEASCSSPGSARGRLRAAGVDVLGRGQPVRRRAAMCEHRVFVAQFRLAEELSVQPRARAAGRRRVGLYRDDGRPLAVARRSTSSGSSRPARNSSAPTPSSRSGRSRSGRSTRGRSTRTRTRDAVHRLHPAAGQRGQHPRHRGGPGRTAGHRRQLPRHRARSRRRGGPRPRSCAGSSPRTRSRAGSRARQFPDRAWQSDDGDPRRRATLGGAAIHAIGTCAMGPDGVRRRRPAPAGAGRAEPARRGRLGAPDRWSPATSTDRSRRWPGGPPS